MIKNQNTEEMEDKDSWWKKVKEEMDEEWMDENYPNLTRFYITDEEEV